MISSETVTRDRREYLLAELRAAPFGLGSGKQTSMPSGSHLKRASFHPIKPSNIYLTAASCVSWPYARSRRH